MDKFVRARDNQTGRVLHVKSLTRSRNGDACDCRCLACNKPVRSYQGWVNTWHFRPIKNDGCYGGNPMTALHKEATQILADGQQMVTRQGLIEYSNTSKECIIEGSKFRADVKCTLECGEPLLLEVRVTHACDHAKIEYIL